MNIVGIIPARYESVRIEVVETAYESIGVDTPEDLKKVQRLMRDA